MEIYPSPSSQGEELTSRLLDRSVQQSRFMLIKELKQDADREKNLPSSGQLW